MLDHGDLATAIRASMAFPGMFTPVEIDGQLLVDGGVLRNLPIDVAQELGADRLIAIDVGSKLETMEGKILAAQAGPAHDQRDERRVGATCSAS